MLLCECKKVEDAKFCQQVVIKKGTFKNVEMYAAAVAYHCEKMSEALMNEFTSSNLKYSLTFADI